MGCYPCRTSCKLIKRISGDKLDRDCADMCRLAATLMARQSPLANEFCALCAKACKACADECGNHRADHCQHCAQACHACAQACEAMAA
ncbi:four-helix bundle copper-binding protein [Pseudomonas coleopterorum]|uniref:four-helix bundle copper-binding protein n=1 Tax=Pseudomonas coleopterorum TaxID=1605838 RepID=UPI0030B87447